MPYKRTHLGTCRLTFLVAMPWVLPGQTSPPAAEDATSPPATTSTLPAANSVVPLTVNQKIKRRALRLIEPVTLVNSAFSAGISQWRDVPHSWGQGTEGYAVRFASAEGFTVAHNGIALGFDVAFHLDPRYHRMPEAKFKARLWNAVSQTLIATRDGGGKTFNFSEVAGNYGAGFVSNSWQPAGYNSPADALTRGTLGLVFHSAKNVVREFLPDILHHH